MYPSKAPAELSSSRRLIPTSPGLNCSAAERLDSNLRTVSLACFKTESERATSSSSSCFRSAFEEAVSVILPNESRSNFSRVASCLTCPSSSSKVFRKDADFSSKPLRRSASSSWRFLSNPISPARLASNSSLFIMRSSSFSLRFCVDCTRRPSLPRVL